MIDIGTVLRGLYASEIPASVFWEKSGKIMWTVGLDEWGYPSGEADSSSPEQAARAMHEAALKHYPDSVYAKKAKEPKLDFSEKVRRLKAVREATQCRLKDAYEAVEANGTVEAAVAAIRKERAAMGLGKDINAAKEA